MTFEEQMAAAIKAAPTEETKERFRQMLEREKNAPADANQPGSE